MFLFSLLVTVLSGTAQIVDKVWPKEMTLLSQWHSVVPTIYKWDSNIYMLNLNSLTVSDMCLSGRKCFSDRFVYTFLGQLSAPMV